VFRLACGVVDRLGRLNILTDAGDLWVLDNDDIDLDLLGRLVTAEGISAGLDRLSLDWIGEASA
jgi:Protein of unknown function (DUF5818)